MAVISIIMLIIAIMNITKITSIIGLAQLHRLNDQTECTTDLRALRCTGWPKKNSTFFEIPYFCSHYKYNRAVLLKCSEITAEYNKRQFFNEC